MSVPFIEQRGKTNLSPQRTEERRARRISAPRGVCSKFSSFSYPEPAMEGSESKIQREGLEWSVWIQDIRFVFSPRFLLHPPASSCKSFQGLSTHLLCLWLKLRQRNFLTNPGILPQDSPGPRTTGTRNPNVLRRDHKRACNDLARADALMDFFFILWNASFFWIIFCW